VARRRVGDNPGVAEDAPDLIVIGERVALGPLRRDLAATYARWVNGPEVREGLLNLGIDTPETVEAWVDEQVKKAAERPPAAAHFTIYDRSDDAPVGTVGLFDISYVHSSAELGIAIGERRHRGLGTEATRLMLLWAFRTLGLHNVILGALAWNEGALRAYERAGFRRIGVRRGGAVSRGERVDVVLMDAIPDDLA
ncbi:MAG TPA: GNAT family protein, partial [Solirubrobacteraceae bacterium]|nr:GNAT family protein [Solirubrobacteraceae bacterium]